MTTFTLQELNLPTTAEQAVEQITKEEFMEYGMNNPLSANARNEELLNSLSQTLSHAPEPQPSQVNPERLIEEMVAQFSISLKLLLTSVISQAKAQPVEEKSSSNESLQETVALVLQQSDWFRTMVRHELVGLDIEDIAKNAVESLVEDEVESYFSHSFDASDHFDFNDAVNDAVSDQIEDAVSDKIDEAVDEYMSNATITICK